MRGEKSARGTRIIERILRKSEPSHKLSRNITLNLAHYLNSKLFIGPFVSEVVNSSLSGGLGGTWVSAAWQAYGHVVRDVALPDDVSLMLTCCN